LPGHQDLINILISIIWDLDNKNLNGENIYSPLIILILLGR